MFVVQVYERAIPAVPKEQRLSILELYVSRATDFFGIAKVRQQQQQQQQQGTRDSSSSTSTSSLVGSAGQQTITRAL
jgi:pre-mRNA-splicing factor SYF1